MHKLMMAAAALAMLSVSAPVAYAQKIDAKGRCHDVHGKFAKMEVCKGLGGEHHLYKLDGKGACHDEKGKFAKREMCH